MIHQFDSFELDDERFLLRHRGEAVRMEPRVLDVLVYLVRNRGRIVTKEELIDTVWNKKFISESALTRCVAEARRTLMSVARRDDGYVTTVHGRGYRFDVAASSVKHETEAESAAPKALPARKRRLSSLIAVVPLLLLSSVPAQHREQQQLRIAILPVSSQDDDAELRLVALSMSDLLLHRLGTTEGVIVRAPDQGALAGTDSLAAYAIKAGAGYVVSGTLRRSAGGAKAQLAAMLYEVRSPTDVRETPLGRFDIPLPGTSVAMVKFVETRDRIVDRLVAKLLPAVQPSSARGMVPRDAQAYRFYLLASDRLAAGGCDGDTPLELLERSLEIDSLFAPAWVALGWAHYAVVSSCGGRSEHYRQAIVAADRALSIRADSTDAIGLKARILTETGRTEEAFVMLRAAIRDKHSNADLHALLAHALTYAGQLSEAERWLDALLKIDPDYLTSRGWTPNAYLYSGNTLKFLQALPATDTPRFRYYRGLAELKAGRDSESRAVLEPAFRLNPADMFGRLSQALLAVIERRPDEAREVINQIIRDRQVMGGRDGETTYRIAQLLVLAGDLERGGDQLARSVEEGFFCAACMENDTFLAPLRRGPKFAVAMSRASQRQLSFRTRLHGEFVLTAR